MGQYKIIADVHQPSYPLEEVRRWCSPHQQPPIMSDLLLLPTAIETVVDQACSPLSLLRLTAVHLSIHASRCVVLLCRALSPQLGCHCLVGDGCILTQRPLYVLLVRIDLIKDLVRVVERAQLQTASKL